MRFYLRCLAVGILVASAVTCVAGKEETMNWSDGLTYGVKYFAVGDKLTFSWSGTHALEKLETEAKYNSCDFAGAQALKRSIYGASYEYTFTASDATQDFIYFACSVSNHCNNGQKIKVKVTSEPPSPGPAPAPENPYDAAFSARPSLAIFVGALLLLAMVVV